MMVEEWTLNAKRRVSQLTAPTGLGPGADGGADRVATVGPTSSGDDGEEDDAAMEGHLKVRDFIARSAC